MKTFFGGLHLEQAESYWQWTKKNIQIEIQRWSNNLCYYIACCSLSESNRKDHRASTHAFLEFNVAKKEILNSQMAPLSTPYRHLHARAVLLIVAGIVAGILGVLNTDITPENISSRLWPTFNWFISVSTFFYSMCVLKKCFWCYFLTYEDRIAHDFVCVYVWFRFWVRNRLLVRFSSWCYFSTESNYLWHFRVCILWTYLSN